MIRSKIGFWYLKSRTFACGLHQRLINRRMVSEHQMQRIRRREEQSRTRPMYFPRPSQSPAFNVTNASSTVEFWPRNGAHWWRMFHLHERAHKADTEDVKFYMCRAQHPVWCSSKSRARRVTEKCNKETQKEGEEHRYFLLFAWKWVNKTLCIRSYWSVWNSSPAMFFANLQNL